MILKLSIILFFIYLGYYFIYMRVNPKLSFPKTNYRYCISGIVLLVIYILISCLSLVLSGVVSEAIDSYITQLEDIKDLIVIFILILGFKLGDWSFSLISHLLRKISNKFSLYCIGRNGKTWCVLLVSLYYIFISFLDERLGIIRTIGISIIIGRFFWVLNERHHIKKVLLSFFILPHNITVVYIGLTYAMYNACIKNASQKQSIISCTIGILLYYIFILIKHWKQIISTIIIEVVKEMEKESKEENKKEK